MSTVGSTEKHNQPLYDQSETLCQFYFFRAIRLQVKRNNALAAEKVPWSQEKGRYLDIS